MTISFSRALLFLSPPLSRVMSTMRSWASCSRGTWSAVTATPEHTQAAVAVKSMPPGIATRARGLEFLNAYAALGERIREVADNPEMIIADQVEREPSAIVRQFVGRIACHHDEVRAASPCKALMPSVLASGTLVRRMLMNCPVSCAIRLSKIVQRSDLQTVVWGDGLAV